MDKNRLPRTNHDSSRAAQRNRLPERHLNPRARTSASPVVFQYSLGTRKSSSALRALEQLSRLGAVRPNNLSQRGSGLSLSGETLLRPISSGSTLTRHDSAADARDFSTVSLDSSRYNRVRLARNPHLWTEGIAGQLNSVCDSNGINAAGAEVMVIVAYEHPGGTIDPTAPPHYTVFFLDSNLRVLVWKDRFGQVTTRIHLELRPISHDYYWPVNSFAMVGDKSEWLARCGESRVVPLHQGGSESERSERLAMILEGAARELREGQS